jgi:hypothetical protein
MTIYAGFDVSDKTTHICVVDGDGAVLRRDVQATDPDVLAKWLRKHCRDGDGGLVRVVLETGPLSTFRYEVPGHGSGDTILYGSGYGSGRRFRDGSGVPGTLY